MKPWKQRVHVILRIVASPVIVGMAMFLLSRMFSLDSLDVIRSPQETERLTLVSVSATFVGFLLTIMTIWLSFSPNNEYMKRMASMGHITIIKTELLLGIVCFCVAMVTAFLNVNWKLAIFTFGIGLTCMSVVVYYLYKIQTFYKKFENLRCN